MGPAGPVFSGGLFFTEFPEKGAGFVHGVHGAVFQHREAELSETPAHQAFVRKEDTGLITDTGQAHFFSHIGDAPDGNVGLVGDDAVDPVLLSKAEDLLLVPDVDDQTVCDIGVEILCDDRGGEQDIAGLRSLLYKRELETSGPDDQELFSAGMIPAFFRRYRAAFTGDCVSCRGS